MLKLFPWTAGISLGFLVFLAGCAQPTVVVTPTSPTPPSPQPARSALVLSVPIDLTRPALITQVNVFGETVTAQANVGPQDPPTNQAGVSSTALSLGPGGSPLFTANNDGTVSGAPVGGQSLQTKNVTTSSLPPGGVAAHVLALSGAE